MDERPLPAPPALDPPPERDATGTRYYRDPNTGDPVIDLADYQPTPEQRAELWRRARVGVKVARAEWHEFERRRRRAGVPFSRVQHMKMGEAWDLVLAREQSPLRCVGARPREYRPLVRRRAGSSSRTASCDPGDDDGPPEPPRVARATRSRRPNLWPADRTAGASR